MRTAAFLPDGDAWTAIFGILLNGARDRYRQTAEYRHCLEMCIRDRWAWASAHAAASAMREAVRTGNEGMG